MERNDELWINYLNYCAQSSRNLLSSGGWTIGACAGMGANASMLPMLGLMAVSTRTGVMSFPDMINGTGEFSQGGPANVRNAGSNNCMMDLWSMALNNQNR